MTTPLPPDPRFPDRPNTRDFWRLSHVLIENDMPSTNFQKMSAEVVDLETLRYASAQRAGLAITRLRIPPAFNAASIQAVWIDGFLAGARFQQEGGHTE